MEEEVLLRLEEAPDTAVVDLATAVVQVQDTAAEVVQEATAEEVVQEVAMKAVTAAVQALQTSKGAQTAHGWTSSVHLELYAIPIHPVVVSFCAIILVDTAEAVDIHLAAADIHQVATIPKKEIQ